MRAQSVAMRAWTFPALALLALAGCIGGGDRDDKSRRDRRADIAPSSAELRQCLAKLTSDQVRFSPLPDRQFGGGCQAVGAVQLLEIGTPVNNLGAMTCPLASRFSDWVRFGVGPAARTMLGSDVVRVDTMGTYACRNVVGGSSSARLSEHARANAVDVAAFVLADGRKIRVAGGWNEGSDEERAFLRRIRESACKRFVTVLSPDYNAAHHDHLHLDMGGGRLCR